MTAQPGPSRRTTTPVSRSMVMGIGGAAAASLRSPPRFGDMTVAGGSPISWGSKSAVAGRLEAWHQPFAGRERPIALDRVAGHADVDRRGELRTHTAGRPPGRTLSCGPARLGDEDRADALLDQGSGDRQADRAGPDHEDLVFAHLPQLDFGGRDEARVSALTGCRRRPGSSRSRSSMVQRRPGRDNRTSGFGIESSQIWSPRTWNI